MKGFLIKCFFFAALLVCLGSTSAYAQCPQNAEKLEEWKRCMIPYPDSSGTVMVQNRNVETPSIYPIIANTQFTSHTIGYPAIAGPYNLVRQAYYPVNYPSTYLSTYSGGTWWIYVRYGQ